MNDRVVGHTHFHGNLTCPDARGLRYFNVELKGVRPGVVACTANCGVESYLSLPCRHEALGRGAGGQGSCPPPSLGISFLLR